MPHDARTIMQAQRGDTDAIGRLWDAHTRELYGYLMHTVRDTDLAEDLLQRTWVAAIEALPTFGRRGVQLRAWLFAIARNECRQHWRRSGREEPLDLERHDVAAPDGRGAREAHSVVESALTRLTPDDRELLRLRYIADLSTADIARVLGVSGVAVRVRLHRALRRACAVLEPLV